MSIWPPLRRALAQLRQDNIALPVWWRDDDAIEPTPQLDQLIALSEELAMPAHLAVIPAHAKPALVPFFASNPRLYPLIHGWAHKNHAPREQKSSEFGTDRAEAEQDAKLALTTLRGLFGDNLVAMFVPPWNRIHPDVCARLGQIGYDGFSTYGPRPDTAALTQINTHIDPIFWRGHRGLVDPDLLIARTVDILTQRRSGRQDATEPLGYLTHHLVHTPEIWEFSRNFLHELQDGGATCVNMKDALT